MAGQKPEIHRREFLTVLGCGSCAALTLTSTGCTIAEIFETGGGDLAYNVSEPQFSPLASVDGVVPVEVAGRPILLIRTDEQTIVALNRICTHVQCDMDPQISGAWDGEKLICLCHDSHFDAQGRVLQGPATRDLQVYPTTFDAATGVGTVTVGLGESDDAPPPEDPVPEEFRDLTSPYAAYDTEALAAGEALWVQCGSCHGPMGEGNQNFPDPKPTAFNGNNSGYSDGYLFWRLRTGGMTGPEGSIMPAYSPEQMSDDQIWQVLTYLRSLGQ